MSVLVGSLRSRILASMTALFFTLTFAVGCKPASKDNRPSPASQPATGPRAQLPAYPAQVPPQQPAAVPAPQTAAGGACAAGTTASTESLRTCCVEKKLGTTNPASVCQAKCWTSGTWATIERSCGGGASSAPAATGGSNGAVQSAPSENVERDTSLPASLTFETATCAELYANPGIGTDSQYCKKCYAEGGQHSAYCDGKGILQNGTEQHPATTSLPSTYNPATKSSLVNCVWWQYEKIEDIRAWNPFAACTDKQEGDVMWKACEKAGGLGVNISCNCEKYAKKRGQKTQHQCLVALQGKVE